MIKFFRKIRRKLISESKTGTYLKYAIGEIILVVIGILIALQINNWNIKKQEGKIETANLNALQVEFERNKELLNEAILLNERIIKGSEKMIQTFRIETLDTISERTIAVNTSEALTFEINFAPETGVLSEILNSGDLKLFQNNELKHHLAGFPSWIERTEQQENEVYAFRKDIANQINQLGNLKKMYTEVGEIKMNWDTTLDTISNNSLFTSITLLNQLIVFKSASESTTIYLYEPLDKEMDKILELIRSDLKLK